MFLDKEKAGSCSRTTTGRKDPVPPIRAESVLMALTKGWPEPTEPDWSTAERERRVDEGAGWGRKPENDRTGQVDGKQVKGELTKKKTIRKRRKMQTRSKHHHSEKIPHHCRESMMNRVRAGRKTETFPTVVQINQSTDHKAISLWKTRSLWSISFHLSAAQSKGETGDKQKQRYVKHLVISPCWLDSLVSRTTAIRPNCATNTSQRCVLQRLTEPTPPSSYLTGGACSLRRRGWLSRSRSRTDSKVRWWGRGWCPGGAARLSGGWWS